MTESNTSSNDQAPTGDASGVIGGTGDASDASDASGIIGGTSGDGAIKDTDDWVTGDEPMTGAQRSYLETLAREAGETLSADLTKAQASEHIDRLQSTTGRGAGS